MDALAASGQGLVAPHVAPKCVSSFISLLDEDTSSASAVQVSVLDPVDATVETRRKMSKGDAYELLLLLLPPH